MLAPFFFLLCNFGASKAVVTKSQQYHTHIEHLLLEKLELDSQHLQKLLSPFQNQNCLVIIRNFLLINHEIKFIPLIIHHMVIDLPSQDHYEWVMHSSNHRFQDKYSLVGNASELSLLCRSPFLAQFTTLYILDCMSINATRWIVATKTWNCMCVVDLFVPTYNGIDLSTTYPLSFVTKQHPYKYSNSPAPFWQATVPQINILISTQNTSKENVEDWMEGIIKYSSASIFAELLFYVCPVNQAGYIQDIIGYDVGFTNHVSIDITTWTSIPFDTIARRSLIHWRDLNVWLNELYDRKAPIGVRNALLSCRLHHPINRRYLSRHTKSSVDIISAYLTLIVMGNYSYHVEAPFVCQYPGVIHHKSEIHIPESSAYENQFVIFNFMGTTRPIPCSLVLSKSQLSFRFITCISESHEGFSFKLLAVVFQPAVWLSTFFSYLMCAIVFKRIEDNVVRLTSFQFTVDMFILLLEQTPAFVSSFRISRNALAALILATVVISNAYKSSTVCKMILPMTRLKYQNIQQLDDLNFTMYTRIGEIQYTKQGKRNKTWCPISTSPVWETAVYNDQLGTQMKCISIFAISETIFRHGNEHSFRKQDETAKVMSSLHPQSSELLQLPFNTFNFTKIPIKDMESAYRGAEEKVILESLAQCNRTALLLPQFEVPRYQQMLLNEPYRTPIDVSSEEYFVQSLIVNFYGYPTFPVFKRIQAIQQSGIPNWLMSNRPAWNEEENGKQENGDPRPAKMSGNVSVVFVCLLIGYALSLLVILLEILKINCLIR